MEARNAKPRHDTHPGLRDGPRGGWGIGRARPSERTPGEPKRFQEATLAMTTRGELACFLVGQSVALIARAQTLHSNLVRLGFEFVGQSGRHPIPDIRRPDQKSLQTEATTCRSPGSVDCPGFFFVAVKRR
jgi:hypothetical protein